MLKSTAIIVHITCNVLDGRYKTEIFTEPKGKLGTNVRRKVQHYRYDHIIFDATNERDFTSDLDPNKSVAFYEGTVKHVCFAAETKGSASGMQLRLIEGSQRIAQANIVEQSATEMPAKSWQTVTKLSGTGS